MKHNYYCLIVVFFIIYNSNSFFVKSQNFSWAMNIGGSGQEYGKAITTDAYSNVYVTGSFSGTADFDPGIGTYNLISKGSEDIFVAKYSQFGILIWAIALGGTSSETGKSIAVDKLGNVYLTGQFMGTVDFNPGTAVKNITSNGNYDIFIAKYSSSGVYLWAYGMGSSNWDYSEDIGLDTLGNVIFTGCYTGTVDFNSGSGVNNLTSAGGMDIFIANYSTNGTYSWALSLGSSFIDWGMSLEIDNSGNIYTTGIFSSTVDFDPGNGTNSLTSKGGYDIYVAMYKSSGSLVWAFGMGSSSDDSGFSIDIDKSGNVYVAGNFYNTVDFDPDTSTKNLISSGSLDVFIAKYTNNGNYIWANKVGGNCFDKANSIAVDFKGNLFITGEFECTTDFNPGQGTDNITATGGPNDSYILSLDSAGNYNWAYKIGSSLADIGYAITVQDSGNVFATGVFSNTIDFNPGTAINNLTSYGAYDVYITKLINSNCEYFHPQISPKDTGRLCTGSKLELSTHDVTGYLYQWYRNSTVINGATKSKYSATFPGTYNVVVTSNSGCIDTTTNVQVIALQLPVAEIALSGNDSFCIGDSTMLKANTGNGLSWQWEIDGNILMGATDSFIITRTEGHYKVIVTDSNMCSKKSNEIIISQLSLPDTTLIINGSPDICQGDTVELNAKESGMFYRWQNNGVDIPGALSSSFKTTKPGKYSVIITTPQSCSDTSSQIEVSILTLPDATVYFNQDTILCEGDSLQLKVKSAMKYAWFRNDTIPVNTIDSFYYVNNTGNYSVFVTDSFGCKKKSDDIFIRLFNLPDTRLALDGNTELCKGDSLIMSAKPDSSFYYQWFLNKQTIPGANNHSLKATANGEYSVVIINSFKCIDTSEIVSVNVNELPDTTVYVSGYYNFCNGDSTILLAAPGLTYQWYKDGIQIPEETNEKLAVYKTGTYHVRLTNNAGCSNTSNSFFITSNPLPDINIGCDTTICRNHSLLLDAGFGYLKYDWSTGEKTQTIVLNPNSDTGLFKYWVTVTNNSLCQTTDTIAVTVVICSDLPEFENNCHAIIYPNPSNGQFTLLLDNLNSNEAEIYITDLSGKILISTKIEIMDKGKASQSYHLNYLPSGLYILAIKSGNNYLKEKIILH